MAASEPLGVRPPAFVERPPESAQAAIEALRALYRDFFEQRPLDSAPEESVDLADADRED